MGGHPTKCPPTLADRLRKRRIDEVRRISVPGNNRQRAILAVESPLGGIVGNAGLPGYPNHPLVSGVTVSVPLSGG